MQYEDYEQVVNMQRQVIYTHIIFGGSLWQPQMVCTDSSLWKNEEN